MKRIQVMVVAMVQGMALMLAGCGGGGGAVGAANTTPSSQAAFAVGEPNGAAPVVADFTAMAKGAQCAGVRNDLYVIDNHQVLWDRAGQCADNSYSQVLFGATPGQVLCSVSDGIAGPRIECKDESARPLFESVLQNLTRPNLGLAASHKVDKYSLAAGAGFTALAHDDFAAVAQPRTVVIQDAAAFGQLWAEIYAQRTAVPGVPAVDFSRQMVVGVFAGQQNAGCRTLAIVKTATDAAGLEIDYQVTTLQTFAPCAQSTSNPGALAVVDRTGAPVRFVDVSPH